MNPPPLPPASDSPPPARPSPPPPLPAPPAPGPVPAGPTLTPAKTLRRLFLTLFLRGHSARGLQKGGAPKSVGRKLALTLLFSALIGLVALGFKDQNVFALSLYLHGMTFMLIGMFVASSAGEVLFNQQEADILLHRPLEPRMLLWAKIAVLIQVSLWMGAALNLTGFFVGVIVPGGGWLYPIVHALSTTLEALFCTGSVVLIYQLCLRWFGRERLNGLMTTVQVVVAVVLVGAGQIVPRLIGRFGGISNLDSGSWWLALLPPAWFAGLDDVLAGEHHASSWMLAAAGLVASFAVLWFAFVRLADDYLTGLQTAGEATTSRRAGRPRRRWLGHLIAAPPLSWWLRDSVSRASFQLTLAYLIRDRDMKLRVYPGMAPMMVMPFIFVMQSHGRHGNDPFLGGFGIAFMGAYLGLIPLFVLNMIQYSQHWQAADLFRAAPQTGPAALYHGARLAVLLFFAFPLTVLFGGIAWLLSGTSSAGLVLLIPGVIAMPIYSLLPGLRGHATPLSQPIESAKSASRGLNMLGVMMVSLVLALIANFSWHQGWFGWFILIELAVVLPLYYVMCRAMRHTPWPSME